MPTLFDEIKSGVEYGTAVGSFTAAAFSLTSTSVDRIENAIQSGARGGAIGGMVGGTTNSALWFLRGSRHFVDKRHKQFMAFHKASHNSNDSCILCNPQKSLDLS